MVQKEQDRRVRRTRRQLQTALATLMREKELKDITVRELADLADVNRGTFYSHYKDLYDMRDQVEQELFEQLCDVLSAYDSQSLQEDLTPLLMEVFGFVLDNREIFVTILGQREEERFFIRLRSLIHDKYLQEWNGIYDLGAASSANYCLEFVVSGVVGLARAWAESGMVEPPEKMAVLVSRLIMGGLPKRREDRDNKG